MTTSNRAENVALARLALAAGLLLATGLAGCAGDSDASPRPQPSASASPSASAPEPSSSASAPEPSSSASAPEPSSSASAPSGTGEVVRGWPTTSKNRAGVYSWDGDSCAGASCIVGFMHNGYGSGNVALTIERVSGGTDPGDEWMAATVAGHDGHYRRTDALREEWRAEIEGTMIAIRLSTKRRTSQTELNEAHAIVDSMRTEERGTKLGFRLVFTLATDDWDSG